MTSKESLFQLLPRRVLVVAHNAVAGSNRKRLDALARLAELDVTLLTPPWWHEEGACLFAEPSRAEGFRWDVGKTLANGNATRYLYLSRLAALIRSRPDVIDVQEEPFSLVALQTTLLRDAFAPRAALTFYSAVNVDRRWRLPYRVAERYVLGRADGASVPSDDVRPILRSRGFPAPVAVLPLGVDVEQFARAEPLAHPLPRPRVGFLGRLEPVKGVGVLLDAFSRLATPASLLIAGDGSERICIEREVARLSIADRTSLLGAVPFTSVPSFLRALDVLVVPSVTIAPVHKEQFGRVVAEAMAAGTLVIGSDSGALPEVIGDGGIVVPERDAAALTGALELVLGDRGLQLDLRRRGEERARLRFGWDVVARRTRDELYGPALCWRTHRLAGGDPPAADVLSDGGSLL